MPSSHSALAALPSNPLFRIGALVHGRNDVLHLEFGEPDFPTPAHITQAAADSLASEQPTYGPNAGMRWLREAIATRTARVQGVAVDPARVVVAGGGTGALTASLLALCGPGDEVLIPDPGWPGYNMMALLPGARPVRYPLLPASGWLPDLEALEAAITPRTRVLIVNSPSNPGGAVFPRAVIEQLVTIAERHDLWLLSDECYDELTFDAEHVSPLAFESGRRVLTVGTFSKAYAMTGWRMGWVVAPSAVVPPITTAVAAKINNLPLFVQRAGYAALTGPQECVAAMREAYRARREIALDMLRASELVEYIPSGAFYLLIHVARLARSVPPGAFDSTAFAEALVGARGVAVGPGAAFGESIPGYVRISLASSETTLRQGIGAMLDYAREYRGEAS